ncbi:MAG: 50S ribosomal protein L22 [Acidimicrobiia bacterium]|nr:50S ribosomal protein L22 [Acidimicrobiia bacterium]MDH3471261.1 50S ribosomal protein L22 [Acidimicrobiia bacterium]
MNVNAHARFIRQSPYKVRQVLNLVRGQHVPEARTMLKYANRKAADPVSKVLESAIANAEHNFALDAGDLVVAKAFADEGPTLKRFRPRARGRATRINKRTSHITIVLSDGVDQDFEETAGDAEEGNE